MGKAKTFKVAELQKHTKRHSSELNGDGDVVGARRTEV